MTAQEKNPLNTARNLAGIDALVQFQQSRTILRVGERFSWRLPLLVLTVARFRGQRASLQSLHTILWGLRTSSSRAQFLAWWNGSAPDEISMQKIDPGLSLTVRLAAAEDLLTIVPSKKVELSERGRELAALIDGDVDLMTTEKEFLRQLTPLNETEFGRRLFRSGSHS